MEFYFFWFLYWAAGMWGCYQIFIYMEPFEDIRLWMVVIAAVFSIFSGLVTFPLGVLFYVMGNGWLSQVVIKRPKANRSDFYHFHKDK